MGNDGKSVEAELTVTGIKNSSDKTISVPATVKLNGVNDKRVTKVIIRNSFFNLLPARRPGHKSYSSFFTPGIRRRRVMIRA